MLEMKTSNFSSKAIPGEGSAHSTLFYLSRSYGDGKNIFMRIIFTHAFCQETSAAKVKITLKQCLSTWMPRRPRVGEFWNFLNCLNFKISQGFHANSKQVCRWQRRLPDTALKHKRPSKRLTSYSVKKFLEFSTNLPSYNFPQTQSRNL